MYILHQLLRDGLAQGTLLNNEEQHIIAWLDFGYDLAGHDFLSVVILQATLYSSRRWVDDQIGSRFDLTAPSR
jgi:hypothetical protein